MDQFSSNSHLPFQPPVLRPSTFSRPPYTTVRAFEDNSYLSPRSILTPRQIYIEWTETDQIYSARHDGLTTHVMGEILVLLRTYRYGMKIKGTTSSQFRDAVLDVIAEFFDHHGLARFPWEEFERLCAFSGPGKKLMDLVALYFALSTKPRDLEARLDARSTEFKVAVEDAMAMQRDDITSMEIWEAFMTWGRCSFHEHGRKECWRAEMDKEVAAELREAEI